MKKYTKYSLVSLISLILLILIIINFTNINFTKSYISEAINNTLGRQLDLNGDIKLKLFPAPNLIVKNIQFQNANWSEIDHMLEADSISIKISLQSLFTGNVKITEIKFDGFKVNLEKNNGEEFNWEFSALKNKENENNEVSTSKTELPFDTNVKIVLTNITVNYKERKREHKVIIKELVLEENKKTEIGIKAEYEDIPINLKINTAQINNMLALGQIPVEIEGELGDIDLHLKTMLPVENINKKQAELKFDIKAKKLSTLNKLIHIDVPKIGEIVLKGKALKENEKITLILDNTSVGDTEINGEIKYDKSGKIPEIISQLNIKNLNLNTIEKFSKKEEVRNDQPVKTDLFSTEPLVFEYLKQLNANVDINIDGITHKVLEFKEIKLQAKLEDGVLNINKFYLKNIRNEELNAKARINTQKTHPEVNIILVTENLQLDKNDTLKKYLSGANTNIKMNIDSKGKSVKQLMNHLNGQLIIKVGKGELDDSLLKFISSNILTDLVNAINPIADKSNTTNLECAAIRFDIKDGLLTADKGIVMQTDKIQIISSGIINLKNETLEFGIRPQAREGVELNLNSLASMVKLSGNITDPEITMSIKDTAVVYSYFATGGATFIAKSLYDTATRDKSPCETAILGPVETR